MIPPKYFKALSKIFKNTNEHYMERKLQEKPFEGNNAELLTAAPPTISLGGIFGVNSQD